MPQVVPVQTYGAPLQSVLVAQVVLHAAGVPIAQAKGTQERLAGVTQVPLELQVALGVTDDVVAHVAGTHTVPAA